MNRTNLLKMMNEYLCKENKDCDCEDISVEDFHNKSYYEKVDFSVYPPKGFFGADHQNRVRIKKKSELKEKLLNIDTKDEIESSRSFEDVFSVIIKLEVFEDINCLTYYDTAERLARSYAYEPLDVYLHRGTLEGMRKLGWDKKIKGIWKLSLDDFNKFVGLKSSENPLKPYQIESFLCIYKNAFKSLKNI